jgi:alcohol dehydrogenase class IV
MALSATWTFPTHIRIGAGRVVEVAEACIEAGMSRPLFVTDRHLAGSTIAGRTLALLRAAGLYPKVFSDIDPDPGEACIAAGLVAMREGGHDGVVAFGGGSALDAGKVIGFMRGQTLPLWEFEEGGERWRAADRQAVAPVVAVPTTAGTGSEVGRSGVIRDAASGAKKAVFHPDMLPVEAILDPELTLGLPPNLTAATGLDAFTHAFEGYCAPGYDPMAEGIAVEAMRLVKEYLPRAYRDGSDADARTHMMAAAALGAAACAKGLGAIHALSHPVGAVHGTHHGLANAVLLPYVLDFNRGEIEGKIERLAGWIGLEGGFAGFTDFVLRLRRDLGVPHTLDRIGVSGEVSRLAKMAIRDRSARTNPRSLGEEDALELYDRALNGRLG